MIAFFRTNRLLVTLVILLIVTSISMVLLIVRYSAEQRPLDARNHTEVHIVLEEDGFHPREVRIKKGTTVTFSTTREGPFWPASNSHPVHELYPEFDPDRPIESDETWSFTADQPGTWGFHDHIRAYYRGTLFVE